VRVLLSNDDGVYAPGLRALAAAFDGDEVWVVAPDREQSASSHAISLHRPLRMIEVGPRRFAVDGTPTDAVYMGLNLVLRSARPDVVVSGVNHGPNLGNDVLYSGTVAAAMEAALLGVNAIAVSLAAPPPHEFGEAARFAAALARRVVANPPPAPLLLNVNVPAGPIRGYRFARLGRRTYGNEVVEKTDPRGRKYYWIGGEGGPTNENIPGSDCNAALLEGVVAVTPLHLDSTHDAVLQELRSWTIPGFEKEPAP
jgi:5'-nucleotidase